MAGLASGHRRVGIGADAVSVQLESETALTFARLTRLLRRAGSPRRRKTLWGSSAAPDPGNCAINGASISRRKRLSPASVALAAPIPALSSERLTTHRVYD